MKPDTFQQPATNWTWRAWGQPRSSSLEMMDVTLEPGTGEKTSLKLQEAGLGGFLASLFSDPISLYIAPIKVHSLLAGFYVFASRYRD